MYRTKPYTKDNGTIYEKIYHIITYPSLHDLDSLKTISASLADDYIVIAHDHDVKNGLPVGLHYHVLIRFENPRSIKTVAKAYGIGENLVRWANDFKGSALYLFHLNDKSIKANKYRYDFSLAYTNISNLEEWLTTTKPVNSKESSDLTLILDHIESEREMSFISLIRWSIANGVSSTLRRNAGLIKECVYEIRKEFSPWTGSF